MRRALGAAGAAVRGYDFSATAGDRIPASERMDTLSDALDGADLVLSLVWARTAAEAAEAAMPLLARDAVYADLNTAARGVKERVAAIGDAHGIAVADVAVLAPVARAAERTPLLASGPGAERFADAVRPFGVPVETLPGPAGDAAERKLLRSVFMKGMAAVVIEALEAARAAGAEEWLHAQMAAEFGPDGAATVDHLVQGTHRHAVRREREVRDALAALDADGRHADMTRAAVAWYERLAAASRPA
ncbi:DUF1932 domain-containing protein [Microbacterium sp. SORGH_AS_0888]|uniref:DUF1932 domain-containing protein n=1 Tax=Microbacterium sp. SORGH_AS_0888 TaxID=3041791 RepID=UPI00278306AD|nr:DUF1932 domain-containing protein [Microbacterium sp. SORGH_AS_0888]MDQ1129748.1 3-hydroxyisobutyrate dehydrogenase-like beta-hydroxyacid dehydrogenase [Microbacterium sp. SORGH_AS_0888]